MRQKIVARRAARFESWIEVDRPVFIPGDGGSWWVADPEDEAYDPDVIGSLLLEPGGDDEDVPDESVFLTRGDVEWLIAALQSLLVDKSS